MRCFFGSMFRAESTPRSVGDQRLSSRCRPELKCIACSRPRIASENRLRHLMLITTSLNMKERVMEDETKSKEEKSARLWLCGTAIPNRQIQVGRGMLR